MLIAKTSHAKLMGFVIVSQGMGWDKVSRLSTSAQLHVFDGFYQNFWNSLSENRSSIDRRWHFSSSPRLQLMITVNVDKQRAGNSDRATSSAKQPLCRIGGKKYGIWLRTMTTLKLYHSNFMGATNKAPIGVSETSHYLIFVGGTFKLGHCVIMPSCVVYRNWKAGPSFLNISVFIRSTGASVML